MDASSVDGRCAPSRWTPPASKAAATTTDNATNLARVEKDVVPAAFITSPVEDEPSDQREGEADCGADQQLMRHGLCETHREERGSCDQGCGDAKQAAKHPRRKVRTEQVKCRSGAASRQQERRQYNAGLRCRSHASAQTGQMLLVSTGF